MRARRFWILVWRVAGPKPQPEGFRLLPEGRRLIAGHSATESGANKIYHRVLLSLCWRCDVGVIDRAGDSRQGLSAIKGRSGGISATSKSVRNVVHSRPAPGMTSRDPPCRQPCALYAAMLFEGFHRIGRAGWLISTAMPDPGREQQPVAANGQGHQIGERGHGPGTLL